MNSAETLFVEGVYQLLESSGVAMDEKQARIVGGGLGVLIANYNAMTARNQPRPLSHPLPPPYGPPQKG